MAKRVRPDPATDPDALLRLAAALQQSGRHREALTMIGKLLETRPDHAVGWNLCGSLHLESGAVAEALQSYERALALNEGYAVARHNRAVALMQSGRSSEAEQEFAHLVALKPRDGRGLEALGICLAAQGKHSEALAVFDQALASSAGGVTLHRNRAELLRNLNRAAEALASYDCAVSAGDDAELRAGRGMVLLSLQRDREALSDFDRVLALSRVNAGGWLGRGIASFRLGRLREALAAFDECLHLRPDDKDALYNRVNTRLLLKQFDQGARDAEKLLQLDPDYPYALGLLLHARLCACDWGDYDRLRLRAANAVMQGRRAVHPFLNLAISDSPALNLRAAGIFARDNQTPDLPVFWRGKVYRHDRMRIAYLSADFHEHATAFLMAGVFEQHDRSCFETIAFSYGPDDRSGMRQRLEKAFDQFLDVCALPDRAIAEKLREMEVDIAIDLKGYTGGARPGILAQRAAPVQVHYLGYPGSLGASTVDYLIVDKIVIPPGLAESHAERIVYLPGCYQCNDYALPDPASVPARATLGLPENAFVFCCFNSSFKIGPESFGVWMQLLHEVPDSVLWLLKSSPVAAVNLRREAARYGIAPDRLIFTEMVPHSEHLARLCAADLALDTFPYGAHTTASNTVRAGVPLLTIAGASFASRVAASILTASGLSELIVTSAEEYLNRAIALGRNPEELAAIRGELRAKRAALPLFDTVLFTRRLERAYAMMYERSRTGLPPASFTVPE